MIMVLYFGIDLYIFSRKSESDNLGLMESDEIR